MELRAHIGKTIWLGLAILGLGAASVVQAANRNWSQSSGTFDFNSAANWGGTLPGNGDSAFVGWTTGSQTITITNAVSDVFIASSLSISNADTGRDVFMYIKGQTFLTNGVGTLLYGGSVNGGPGNGNNETISLAFSNNVTLNQVTFLGSAANGASTLTFAGGTLRGSNLTFNANDAGTWNQLTIASETVNLSSNFTMTAGDNSDITLITNSTVTVAGKLSVAGDTIDQYFILSNSTLTVSNGVLNTGRIDLLNRGTLNVTKDWTNSSLVNLVGGNIVGGVLTNQANGTISGFGAVANIVNSGHVTATNGELQITGAASGAGAYRTVAGGGGATLTFAGGGSISSLFNTNGTIKLTSALTNNSTFVNEGTLVLNVGTYQTTANLTNAAGETIISSDDGTINAVGVINRGTILTTNANLIISNLVVQGGTVTIGTGGSLALIGAGALTNFGTINLVGTSGAGNNAVLNLGSAVLTNLSGGTITGGGIIQNSSQVVNLNGGSILATSSVVELQFTNGNTFGNVGTIGASAGATLTFGSAGVGNAIITNYGTINLSHGTLRSGNITNLANGFFGGTGVVVASVVNQGRMNFSGTLSNGLQNSGSFTLNDDTTIISNLVVSSGGTLDLVGNNLTNVSVLVISSGGGLTNGVAGAIVTGGVSNNGKIFLSQSATFNGPVTNTGGFFFQGTINNNLVNSGSGSVTLNNTATINGTANVNAGTFNLNGQTYTNGLMVVSGTGVLTNAGAGASFSGGLSNDATVAVTANTFFKGPITNTGDFFFQGAISNGLNNSSSFSLNNNGTITGPVANTGTIDASGSVLTVNSAWTNSGTILVDGGTVAGGNLTNNSTLSGPGTVSSLLVNNGQLQVSGGTLNVTQAPVQNGTVNVSGSSALNVTPAWQNNGLVSISAGGNVAGGNLTNAASGTITNNGFVTASLVNQGRVSLSGVISNTVLQTAGSFTVNGNSTITGNTTINGGTLNLLGNRLSNNLLIAGGTGVVTNGTAGATLNGGVSNSATIAFTAATFLNGTVTNLGGFFFEGAISNNLVNNGGTFTLNDDSTITGTATINGGRFDLNGNNYSNRLMIVSGTGVLTNAIDGATFNGGISNAATISVTGNTYFNGPVTNMSVMFFQGAISNSLVNNGSFDLNDDSTLTTAPVNNGTINIGANTLTVVPAWANAGSLQIGGGVLAGGTVTNNSGEGFLGFGTVSNQVVNNGTLTASGGTLTLVLAPVNNGTAIVANASVLNVLPAWTNTGVLSNAPTGALSGGTLTNSGTINGAGFINSQVINQNRMNFGGTISNTFLQTAGSFTVNGGATITGGATINGGVVDLFGNRLNTGQLLVGNNGILSNSVAGASFSGVISNAGTVGFAADAFISSAVTNTGTWTQRGAISNSVNNSGTMDVFAGSGNSRITGGVLNSGSLTFDSGAPVFVTGAVTNTGSFAFNGAISNSLVNSGSIILNNTATVTGTTLVNAGTFNLNGKNYSNGSMIVSGSGVLTNSVAGASFSGGLSNDATVAVTANTFFKGPVTNTGNFFFEGAISNTFVSSDTAKLLGAGTITSTASITAGSFDLNGQALSSSLMVISSGAALTNSTAGASVSGAVNLQNAVLSGQSVNNNAVLSGSGTISAPLNNTAAGVITANGGLLTISGALTQNGTINVATASTLDIVPAFSNSGSLNMQGGFLVGGNINNTAGDNISGFGTISNAIANAGLITATGGTLTLAAAPTTQAGSGINVVSGGTLNVIPDWANSGTLAVSGTLVGGNVTNTSNTGTLNGTGTIDAFVVNQGRMNWGGTINNSLLQTAGSLTLSGNATITGNATINAGGMDLVNNLFTVGQLTINNGATLQNTGNIGTINGAVVNNGTVNFNVNDSFDDSSVAINGQVVNNGTWTEAGTINGTLVNTGSFDWTSHTYFFGFDQEASPLLNGGITNTGSLTFDPSYVARVNGSVTNSGAINFNGTVTGNLWQTSGTFTLNGAGTISGPANVAGGGFNLNGQTYNGSTMVVSGTGSLTNAVAGANFNSGLSNAANVGVTANTFFKGAVTNTGTFAFMGAVSNNFANSGDVILNGSGTISGALANSGSVNVNSGTLSLVVAPTQTGSITVANGATLNAAQAWINNGTITLLGGSVTNAVLTNNGFITGFGTLDGGGVVNNGEVFANASSISGVGTQTVRLTSFTNNNSATLGTASTNAVLNLRLAGNTLINQGTISLSGGTILFNGGAGTITNYNIIAGVGNVASFPIVNAGTLASFVAQAPVSGLSNLIATIGVTNNGLLGANNFINGAATLSLSVVGGGAAIVNQGTVALQGGFLTINGGSGIITNVNNGLIYGVGTQGFQVANLATGTIMASNGVFDIGLQSNANAGVLRNANAASTLLLTNNLLVNNGSVILNGGGLLLKGGAITNQGSISGPGVLANSLYNAAAGTVVATNGVLNVDTNASGSVQNLGVFTITSDGTLNVVPSWLNTNGTVNIRGGGITGGTVTNVGLVSGFGTISSQFVNLAGGTLTAASGSLTLLNAPTQNGSVNITGTSTLNVLQSWLNSGSVNLQGGSLVGSTVTNSGTISGFGTITPLVRNNTGGTLMANGGTLTLSIAPNQLGTVVISNAATLNVLQAWQNNGTLNMFGGTDIGSTLANASTIAGFGTITPQVQNNSGATLTASGGTLTLAVAPTQAGTFIVANGGTLNVLQAWQNSGLLNMAGGTAIGSAITNSSSVSGFGTITPQVINKTTGTITANGGILTLSVAPNQLGGVVVSNAATLNVLQAWQNSGVMNVRGGTVIGSAVTNAANVNGFGTITPQLINNSGATLTASAGTLTLTLAPAQNGTVVITNGGTLNVLAAWQNSGTVAFLGGDIIGATVTNAGTMTGFGGVQNVVNNSHVFVSNGVWHVSGSLVQSGTVDVAANSRLDVTPIWANAGSVLVDGGFTSGGTMTNTTAGLLRGFGTVSNTVVNQGTVLATNGTLNLISAPTQSGTITVANAATLNVAQAWQNGGSVNVQGGSVVGAQLTNAGILAGSGTITSALINNSGATITASGGGTLTLTSAPVQNGTVNILGALNVTSAWANGSAGTVNLNGGVLTGGTFTVDGMVGGNGTIAANMVIGGKTVTVIGGQMNLTALTTMDGGMINSGTMVNYGTISGNGTVNSSLSSPGYVRATNGVLAIQTLTGNQSVGTLEASINGTLAVNGSTPWVNNGRVILSGGTVMGGEISNNVGKTISGFGTIDPNVDNSGQILANNAGQALTFNNSLANLSGGVIIASAGNIVVNGTFTNSGTLSMLHSVGTFVSSVVNSGAWITDPSTNVFQSTYTVTQNGYIQSSAGDTYIFTNNGSQAASFVNQSTQSNAFNTLTGKFVFDATVSLTQTFYIAGNNIGNLDTNGGFDFTLVGTLATNSLAQYQNNFALGDLEVGSTTLVADASVDGGGDNDGLESALFLDDLTLDPGAHLVISNDVQIYFITSNAFNATQVTLLGNAGLHQLTTDASLVIPEPSIVLLWMSSLVTVYAARRRNARSMRSAKKDKLGSQPRG